MELWHSCCSDDHMLDLLGTLNLSIAHKLQQSCHLFLVSINCYCSSLHLAIFSINLFFYFFCCWISTCIECYCSDEGVHWAVQNGLHLSRSTVVYFKHNDMASLASTLEKLTRGNKRAEKIRRYIVVESIYQVWCRLRLLCRYVLSFLYVGLKVCNMRQHT